MNNDCISVQLTVSRGQRQGSDLRWYCNNCDNVHDKVDCCKRPADFQCPINKLCISAKQINEIVSTQPKPKTVNLLDDSQPLSPIPTQTPLNDATNDLSRPIFNDGPSSLNAKPSQNPLKSLFDDDLEDDFLSFFSPKPKPPEQKLKSSLFDDDNLDVHR